MFVFILQAGQVQVDDFVLDTSAMCKQVSTVLACCRAAGPLCWPSASEAAPGQGQSHGLLACWLHSCFPAHALLRHYRRAAAQWERWPSGSEIWTAGAMMTTTGSRVSAQLHRVVNLSVGQQCGAAVMYVMCW